MGIDLERFPEVNPELICSICAGVLENPMELPCRHVFCYPCISRWLDTNHSCPICRKKVRFRNLKPALPILKNIISKLKIRCDFVQQGCTETVELERLGAHTSLCPFAPMTCENEGCELTFPRRSKADHEAECPQRVIFCSSTCSQGCGLQLRRAELPGHSCVKSLKSRVEELERTVSDYSQRIFTLEETVNELRRQRETDQSYHEHSQRGGLANALRNSEANRQQDADSGVISLLSEDEESESHSSSTTVGFGGMTSTHPVSLTTVELADTILTGQRKFRRERSFRRSPPRRERNRSRSPLRRNERQDGTSRRDGSPSESTCRRRTTCRPRRPKPITPSSTSTSSTSASTCGNSDSPVVQSRERRHSRPPVIDDSSSEDTPRITGEIWQHVTGTEVLQFDRRRTTRRPRRPKPITPSSTSTSSTSASTCGNSDSPVVQSRERRHSRPPVIDDSSSEDTPRITGEIWHNVTGTEVLQFDRIPERAVFSTPPDSIEVSAYFGDRQVHQRLQRAIGESFGSNNNSSGGSSSSTNSSSSPSTSC